MNATRKPLHVLFIYADEVGASMGGVGIRAVELGRVVQDQLGAQVTIAAASSDGADVGMPVLTFDPHSPRALRAEIAAADAVVSQPGWPLLMRRLGHSGCRLIFDLYDPEVFSTLENFSGRRQSLMAAFATDRVTAALRVGHHVMCASERQRDLWLGAILGGGLISPGTWERDRSMRETLDVVPYGVPKAPPSAIGSWNADVRNRLGMAPDEEMVLWNGGLWSWFDAPTAIRAVALLRKRRPGVRLVFMGASIAEPAVRATQEAKELARELGELGGGVIFNDSWVPYEERSAWLATASCAISTHVEHLETRFSSRTRLLDCFWAQLPVVCTRGDDLAARVERDALGETVPPGDHVMLADALERVLQNGRAAYAPALATAAEEHHWPRVAQPLLRWLEGPPPPRPLGSGRGMERRPSERMRTAAYLLAARGLTTARIKAPRMR